MINPIKPKVPKRFQLLSILSLLAFALTATSSAAKDKTTALSPLCRDLARFGLPSLDIRLLCKSRFLVGYSDRAKAPLWTIERLDRSRIPVSTGGETRSFAEDEDIPQVYRTTLQDYIGSGFDRGHLVAAGNHVDNPKALRETYLLSNIVPQVGAGFNRGIWRLLEEEVRQIGQCTDELLVFTGVHFFKADPTSTTIGPNGIAVPKAFFKVLYLPTANVAIAFHAKNESYKSNSVRELILTVDELEQLSGYNFFRHISNDQEVALESQRYVAPWRIVASGASCKISVL